jgi:16S rRNA (guanine527-N7)-methyltransferase
VDSWFENRLEALKITPSIAMMKQFALYHDFLISKNAVMNLTAITTQEEVYLKHFIDSLSLNLAFEPKNQTILDVGSGAGFPSLPLKIVYPDLKVTIIDSLEKRILFLKELVQLLDLKNVTLIHGRAEQFSLKNSFDIVTARAVAKLNVLTELCLPFVKPQGLFIAMKQSAYQDELKEALPAISLLGGIVEKALPVPLDENTQHALVLIRKIKATDEKYPRIFAQIKKKPL